MTRRTRRKRFGTRRIKALQRVRDRALQRREERRAGGRVRRLGRRAERARPWLQLVADVAALLARLVR
ncbi:hypothetical protein ACQEVY_27260 [Streptomyces sp. CA-288835]|uniref:hypothetical protein n=1 Tax=unclassified Streptomyces TaxID=2593676 RepID=UPI002E2BE283|nr:hypothetical protein [Streptomyces sp. NBC_00286]